MLDPLFLALAGQLEMIGVVVRDVAGALVYANSAFCRLTGWRAAELLAFSPDELAAHGLPVGPLQDASPPLRDVNGARVPGVVEERPVGTSQVMTVISDPNLGRDRALLRGIVDAIPDLVFAKDADGVYLACNEAFAGYVGAPRDTVLGQTDAELFDLDTAVRYRHHDALMMAAGHARRNEEWITYPDGRRVLLDTLKTPWHGPDGDPGGVLGVSRDITQRKAAEQAIRHREAHYRELFEKKRAVGLLIDPESGQIVDANQAACRFYGWSKAELRTRRIQDINTLTADEVAQRMAAANSHQPGQFFFRHRRADGSVRDVEVWSGPVELDGARYLYSTVHDITARREAERALRLAATVFENANEGIMVTDARGTIEAVNSAFTRITGYAPGEVIGHNPRILKSDQHDAVFYTAMWDALQLDGYWSGAIWNRDKNGRTYPERLSISAVTDEGGAEVTHYVGIFTDLSSEVAAQTRLEYLAHHDPLTGLANRNTFERHLRVLLNEARLHGRTLAVLFIDLDGFKLVNDLQGHAVGDQVLQQVATRLQGAVRPEDHVARIGGDEFVVLVSGVVGRAALGHLADRLIKSVGEPFDLEISPLGASVGIACWPDDGQDGDTLLRHADHAMYAAKAGGRNTWRFYDAAAPDEPTDA